MSQNNQIKEKWGGGVFFFYKLLGFFHYKGAIPVKWRKSEKGQEPDVKCRPSTIFRILECAISRLLSVHFNGKSHEVVFRLDFELMTFE